jgi:hypothetical protein
MPFAFADDNRQMLKKFADSEKNKLKKIGKTVAPKKKKQIITESHHLLK